MNSFRLYTLGFFLVLGSSLFAGKIDKGYQALKVYDYFKAKKSFEKGLKYNQSPAAQGLSIIYLRTDNPFHNLDSALRYVNMSLSSFDLTSDSKKARYAVYGFSQDSILSLRTQISTAIFNMKVKENTVAGFQEFIDVHTWAEELPRAIAMRDSLAFYGAVHTNTSEAFNAFVQNYPSSEYIELAKENYHQVKFVEETGDGSLISFERFVKNNPNSPLVTEARERVFHMITESGSIASFEKFIEAHPDYPQVRDAWISLFHRFLTPYTEERLNAFNEMYPDHPITDRVNLERSAMYTPYLLFKSDSGFVFKSFDNEELLAVNYEAAGTFSEGLCSVAQDSKVGVIDVFGSVRVPFIYESISQFVNGQAIVELNEKFGVIDRNGRIIMDIDFDDISELSEGRRFAQKDDLYGYYDSQGHNFIKHQFLDAYSFEKGKAKVVFKEKEAYIDSLGSYAIPPYFDEVKLFNDSLYVYLEDDMMGLCNAKCDKITDPIFEDIGRQINGLAVAVLDDRIMYINEKGTIILDNEFEVFPNYLVQGTFKDSIAVIYKDEQYGRISLKGAVVNKVKYDNIGNGKKVFSAMKDELWGLFTEGDKTVLEPTYDELYFVNEQLLVARKGDTTGLIRMSGKVVIPFLFESIEKLTDSLYLVKQNGRYGVYQYGELIFPAIYEKVEFYDAKVLRLMKEEETIYFSIGDGRAISSI